MLAPWQGLGCMAPLSSCPLYQACMSPLSPVIMHAYGYPGDEYWLDSPLFTFLCSYGVLPL